MTPKQYYFFFFLNFGMRWKRGGGESIRPRSGNFILCCWFVIGFILFLFFLWATREELKKRAERMIDHAQKASHQTDRTQAESKRTGRVQCFRRAATGLFDCVCVCVCATSFIFFFFLSTGFFFVLFCFLLRCRWYRITLFCIQLTKRKKK